jgi:hypothetical protein
MTRAAYRKAQPNEKRMRKEIARFMHGKMGGLIEPPNTRILRLMSGLAEIQQAILGLAAQERSQLWDWFLEQEIEESPELLAAVDEGIRSIETHGGIPAEEVRRRIATWVGK